MNAFFASVEQADTPDWRDKAIAVTNGQHGRVVITSSYKARSYGVKTGMSFYEAKLRCPEIIQCASRPHRYTQVAAKIMKALSVNLSNHLDVASIDDVFIDMSDQRHLSQQQIITSIK